MDAAVRTVIAPAATVLAEHEGITRWFFLRYIEERGPHLRLRAQAASATIDAVQRAVDNVVGDRLAALEQQTPGRRPALLLGSTIPGDVGARHRGMHRALYQPELEKFGGPAGVALAEEVFEASSRMALEAVRALPEPRSRVRFVLTLMHRLERLLPAQLRTDLWQHYARVWAGAMHEGHAGVLDRLAIAADRLREELAGESEPLVPDAGLAAAVAHYDETLSRMLAEAASRAIGHPLALSSQHMHLTDNRLGFTPIEEALIALTLSSDDVHG
jgi:hypothetical protein